MIFEPNLNLFPSIASGTWKEELYRRFTGLNVRYFFGPEKYMDGEKKSTRLPQHLFLALRTLRTSCSYPRISFTYVGLSRDLGVLTAS